MIPQEIIHRLSVSDLLLLSDRYRGLAEYLAELARVAQDRQRRSLAARMRLSEARRHLAGRNATIKAALAAGESPQALAALHGLTDRQIRRIGSQRLIRRPMA